MNDLDKLIEQAERVASDLASLTRFLNNYDAEFRGCYTTLDAAKSDAEKAEAEKLLTSLALRKACEPPQRERLLTSLQRLRDLAEPAVDAAIVAFYAEVRRDVAAEIEKAVGLILPLCESKENAENIAKDFYRIKFLWSFERFNRLKPTDPIERAKLFLDHVAKYARAKRGAARG
jgi:hypothetical protein